MASVYGLCRVSDPTIRYVGFTSRFTEKRFNEHKINANRKNGLATLPVYSWIRKYDDVTYVVLHDNLTDEEAFELEKREIASRENLLNLTAGGEGTTGYKKSPESIAKMSAAMRNMSAEHRAKLSAAKIGKQLPKIECPNCGTASDSGNAKRWHFNNCKKLAA